MIDHALSYAARGWHVFPIHGINDDGTCTCSNINCADRGKHPRTKNGFKDATTDEVQIAKWWIKWPTANIGIRTGAISDLGIVDIDADRGGFASWDDLVAEHGMVDCLRVITGGGGEHLYFVHPGAEIGNRSDMVPGIDFRGDGGYVVAPPSLHASMKRYEWRVEDGVEDTSMPEWMEAIVRTKRQAPDSTSIPQFSAEVDDWDGEIPEVVKDALTRTTDKFRKTFDRDARQRTNSHVDFHIACHLYELGVTDPKTLAFGIMASRKKDEKAWAKRKSNGYFALTAREAIAEVEKQRADRQRLLDISHPAWSENYPMNELGNAQRFEKIYGEDLLYHTGDKRWMAWDGARFVGDEDSRDGGSVGIERKITRYLSDMNLLVKLATTAEQSDAMHKLWIKSGTSGHMTGIKTITRSSVARVESELDCDPMQLNCANGVLDLETGKLSAHNRSRRMTKITGAPYQPKVKSVAWEKFLREVIPDAETRAFFQQVAGYSLLGTQPEQVFCFIHGPGGTGKSVAIHAMAAAMGSYHRTADFNSFLLQPGGKNSSGPSSDIARLARVRVVSAVEVGHGRVLDSGQVKRLSGGDTVTARHLYGNEVEWQPMMVLWFVANDRPKGRVEDDALWDRILPFRFDQRFRDTSAQDIRLTERLTAPEAIVGLLTWLIEGCTAYLKAGRLVRPQSVLDEIQSYIDHSNPLLEWLNEETTQDEGSRSLRSECWKRYQRWCQDNGQHQMQKRQFNTLMEQKYRLIVSGGQRHYTGLILQLQGA